jgi:hypothetical protein
MTLTGILKNILLVIISVLIWHTSISWLQCLGYAIALAGLVYYSIGWDQLVGISSGLWLYAKGVFDSARGGYSSVSGSEGDAANGAGRLPAAVRRGLIMGVALIVVLILVGGFFYSGGVEQFSTVGTPTS